MADRSLSPQLVKEIIQNQNTKNNVLEKRSNQRKVKLVPGDAVDVSIRSSPMNLGIGLALDIYNKRQKEKGEDPIFEQDLGPN